MSLSIVHLLSSQHTYLSILPHQHSSNEPEEGGLGLGVTTSSSSRPGSVMMDDEMMMMMLNTPSSASSKGEEDTAAAAATTTEKVASLSLTEDEEGEEERGEEEEGREERAQLQLEGSTSSRLRGGTVSPIYENYFPTPPQGR